MSSSLPLIFDIAKGSFVDGPGVRTTVFFKGCPLACPWCHNPEAQNYHMESMFFPEACIQCGNCEQGKECFTGAMRNVGREYTPDQLVQILLEDKAYYEDSSGGITFSGGEALSFINYLSKVAPMLKADNIHIAVQTSGYFDFHEFTSKLLSYIDLLYFDFKIMDDAVHTQLLGRSNYTILENFKKLLKTDVQVIPRILLVPRLTANNENLEALAAFFVENKIDHCEFLHYHPGGRDKLIQLDRRVPKAFPENSASESEDEIWIKFLKNAWIGFRETGKIVINP